MCACRANTSFVPKRAEARSENLMRIRHDMQHCLHSEAEFHDEGVSHCLCRVQLHHGECVWKLEGLLGESRFASFPLTRE